MVSKPPFKDINIITWNARSITNNYLELELLTQELKTEIICVQESMLNKRNPPKIKNFYYINKPKNTSGGLIIYYRKHLKPIEIQTLTTDSESMAIQLNNTVIVNFYNGHKTPLNTTELTHLMNLGDKVIIAGDFNCRHTSWNCLGPNKNGTILKNYIDKTKYIINYPRNCHTYKPAHNRTASTIDFFITKNLTIDQPLTIQALDSDHYPVLTTVPKANSSSIPRTSHFYSTDWKKFKSLTSDNVTINRNHNSTEEIDKSIKNITNTIKSCMYQSTIKTPKTLDDFELPTHIKTQIQYKNSLRKRLQRNYSMTLYQEYKDAINLVRTLMKSIKAEQWEKFTKNLTNSNEMWKITRTLRKNKNTFGVATLKSQQKLLFEDTDKAVHLAETYLTNHKMTQNKSDQQTELTVKASVEKLLSQSYDIPTTYLTSPNEIKQIIKSFSNKKAPGEDKIRNKTLKNLPRKAIVQLHYIYNSCLKLNYFPNVWKNAIVLSFPKPNKDHKIAANYRPISLLPTLSKILEKIILIRIKENEQTHNEIIDEQFGFRTSHSTTLQLATITDQITKNFNYNKTTAMLNLDVEKAFDTVWHDGLIHKLMQSKLPKPIIKIIHSYIKNRTFQTKINKALSNKNIIPAGVPQGGLLSPILFNYYINDIPKTEQTKLKIFADDTAIISESTVPDQANKYIQRNITELEKYYNKWKIKINPTKTTLTHFTQRLRTCKNTITFDGHNIKKQDTVKYLGVTLDKKLNFNKHIENSVRKGKIILREVFPLISNQSQLSKKSKLRIYKQAIRPVFLYANPIWSNTSKTNLQKLQILQNKFLRIILNTTKYTKTKQLHELANMDTIHEAITKQTTKFFNTTIEKLDKTTHLGKTSTSTYNIKIKHKLTHHLMLT